MFINPLKIDHAQISQLTAIIILLMVKYNRGPIGAKKKKAEKEIEEEYDVEKILNKRVEKGKI